jgi:6-phosphogluconolactonase (cycloisomerase 2 family)
LEQSLAITQQIGHRSGLCVTLHNLATIYLNQKEDVEKHLEYEVLAYQIAEEIGDADLVFQVGQHLGKTLCHLGGAEHGLPILKHVYQIGLQSGYPVEKVGALIQRYSQE